MSEQASLQTEKERPGKFTSWLQRDAPSSSNNISSNIQIGLFAVDAGGRSDFVHPYSKHGRSVDLIEAAAPELVSLEIKQKIRIGLVARICRSQSSKDDQFRQGRGSIPRFGISLLPRWRS